MLELYHWEPNVFSLAALVALNEKKLDYRATYVDWLSIDYLEEGGPRHNLEAEHNPEIEGPILLNNGAAISETFFMMEYLDDAFPDVPLKLRTPHGDWQVQVWGRFLGERVAPSVSTLGCHQYLAPLLRERGITAPGQLPLSVERKERRDAWIQAIADSYSEEVLADSNRKVTLFVERVEKALENGDWLVENQFTVADIDAFSKANSLPKLVPDVANAERAPRFTAWLERMRARPSVQRALSTSRTGKPDEAFAPGPEHPRWG